MKLLIAPSILAADFANLGSEVQSVLDAGADWIHVDVMDGCFVPNISMGPMVVRALRKRFSAFLDVHLMVQQPEKVIDDFVSAGASAITVHAEATPHVHRALQQIHKHGLPAGLALNPGTGLDAVRELVHDIDLLLVMTVNPGFGGQAFLPFTLKKIERARALFDEQGVPELPIEVDGGISTATITSAAKAGASVCVAGSAIFSQPNRVNAINSLREACAALPSAKA